LATPTRKKPLPSPKAHVEKALNRKAEETPAFRVYASEVPRETYALLILARTFHCPIERTYDSKFQIISVTEQGKKFTIPNDAQFRRTFNQIVKAFLPSPDQRIEYLKRGEQYAEVCLSIADEHAKSEGYLPLEADKTAPAEDSTPASPSEDAPGITDLSPASPTVPLPSAPEDSRKVKSIKPYGVKEYQTQDYGVLRDSSAILEVEYEGGSKAFRCALCDFERDNHRSINGHMGKHSVEDRKKAMAKANRNVVMGLSWEPTPRENTRITRLANEIAKAMELGLTTPDSIARAIIEARAKDPQRDDDDDSTVSEMSPEQQIEAIRRILGADIAVKEERDQQEKLITGLQNQIDAMRAEMVQVREAKEASDKSLAEYEAWVEKIQAMTTNSPQRN
jgi:hypothetical protein